jgi:phosphomannomutase
MHGVGDPFVQKMFETFGFPQYNPVREQQKADPEFPTVKFPNPEEKGQYQYVLFSAISILNVAKEHL